MMNLKSSLQVAVAMAFVSPAACAEETSPSIWDQIRDFIDPEPAQQEPAQFESLQFEDVIQEQEQFIVLDDDLDRRLESNRQLRALHRETTFQSEMNIAWIRDELDNWDCRVSEQKVVEAQLRIDEVWTFAQRVEEMCAAVGPQATNQNDICREQSEQITRSVQDLEKFRDRYARSCSDFGSVTFQTQGE